MNLKNVLAAFGAVFLAAIALTVVIGLAAGRFSSVESDKVVVVKLEGVILDPTEFIKELKDLEERDDVKGVVVRIDSPGGAVGPSQEIYSQIKRLRKTKPVVASLGSIAASGGLYAAVAANSIVSNPGTITGSIGVIIEFINAEALLAKVGLKGYVVKSGKFKDVGSPLREMKKEEEALLQSVIDDVNGQFVKAVAEGRRLKEEDVRRIADGRIMTGAQAAELGLVDKLGDLTDAVDTVAGLAGITEPEVIYPEKKTFGIWSSIIGEGIERSVADLFSGLKVMYLTPNPAR